MKIEKNIKNNMKNKKNNKKEIKDIIVEEIDIKNITAENKKVLMDRVIEYKEMKEAQENRKVKIEELQNVIERLYKDAGEIIGIKKRNQNRFRGMEENTKIKVLGFQFKSMIT